MRRATAHVLGGSAAALLGALSLLQVGTRPAQASASEALHAPSGPPLVSRSASTAEGGFSPTGGGGEGASEPTPEAGMDPLVSNGLRSPLCGSALAGEGLAPGAAENCRTSGFVAAAAPTENYAFDLHAEGSVLGISGGGLLQEYLLTPIWMALVWVVHTLIVALEWCYTIDLLNSPAMAGVARGMHQLQDTFTQPWLAAALAIASMVALHRGLVRRQVAQTLGDALLMVTMMAAALWVIADPTGTVGALARWSNEASLGALAAADRGTPASARRDLAEGMGELFQTTVQAPWCYLEFGNVQWCRDPTLLDPRLRRAGLALTALDQARTECNLDTGPLALCAKPGSEQARAFQQSAELLRGADTNGALFLALPANQPERNSIDSSASLLQVLCGGDEMSRCPATTAAEAEFRTGAGTSARIEGLLLVGAGALGMVLLIGFIALRLLEAGIVALLYLLLAPVAMLAPAFGEGGRGAFRSWAMHLLGAVASKLIYSLVLGIVLLSTRILLGLQSLGWWMQWLLVSTLWWGAYRHRHQLLGLTGGGAQIHRERSITRRLAGRVAEGLIPRPRILLRGAGRVWGRLSPHRTPERMAPRDPDASQEESSESDQQQEQPVPRPHRDPRGGQENGEVHLPEPPQPDASAQRLSDELGSERGTPDVTPAADASTAPASGWLEPPASGRPESPVSGPPEPPASGRPEPPAAGRPVPPAGERPDLPPRDRSEPPGLGAPESPIMQDAREVAERRKRQLGWKLGDEER